MALSNLSNQADSAAAGLPETGHTATFLNTGTYFMNLNPAANVRSMGPQVNRPAAPTGRRR
jgi:hypothetical protein